MKYLQNFFMKETDLVALAVMRKVRNLLKWCDDALCFLLKIIRTEENL